MKYIMLIAATLFATSCTKKYECVCRVTEGFNVGSVSHTQTYRGKKEDKGYIEHLCNLKSRVIGSPNAISECSIY